VTDPGGAEQEVRRLREAERESRRQAEVLKRHAQRLAAAASPHENGTPLSLVAPAQSAAGELLALAHLKDLPAQLIGETDGWAPVSEPGADLSGR
jgi:hypothetical protein